MSVAFLCIVAVLLQPDGTKRMYDGESHALGMSLMFCVIFLCHQVCSVQGCCGGFCDLSCMMPARAASCSRRLPFLMLPKAKQDISQNAVRDA